MHSPEEGGALGGVRFNLSPDMCYPYYSKPPFHSQAWDTYTCWERGARQEGEGELTRSHSHGESIATGDVLSSLL